MDRKSLAIGVGIGLAIAAAGGAGYWAASEQKPAQPVTVVVPTPMAPPVAAAPAPPVVEPAEPAKQPVTPAAKAPKPSRAQTKPVARVAPAPEPVEVTKAEPVAESPAPQAPTPAVSISTPPTPPERPPVEPVVMKPDPMAQPAPPREPRTVTVPAGTLITVRLNQEVSSEHNSEGDAFNATLDQPLVVDGLVIAERGSRQQGRIVGTERAGRVKGRASIQLALSRLMTADGQSVELQTETFTHMAESTVKRDAARAGVAAAIGAAIGAIAGGGKGAAIGAGAGGAAGTGAVLATRGKEAELRAETRISFRLSQPVTLTEKLKN